MLLKLLSLLFTAVLTALVSWYLHFKWTQRKHTIRYKDGRTVPGPLPKFPFGNALEVKRYGGLSRAVHTWRKQYGDEFQFWFGTNAFLYVHDLEVLKDVSAANSPYLSRFQSWARLERSKNKGIVATNDFPHHKIHRAAALTRLMRTSYLRRVAEITCEKMDRLLEILEAQSQGKPHEVQADQILQNVTLDIIGQAAFSLDLASIEGDKYAERYSNPLRASMEIMTDMGRFPSVMKYLLYPKWKAGLAANKKIDEFYKQILLDRREEQKKGITREDFMDYLVTEKDPRTNQNFTDQEIMVDIGDLLAAGHETTSNTICFALYFLAWNLDVQKTLQEECDRFPSKLSYEEAARLIYTQGVIKETLRIQPTVEGLSRSTETAQVYRNYIIPETGSFVFSMVEFGNDPKYFPNPEKFDPTRWLKSDDETDVSSSQNEAWFAFGAGARACIGNRMAMMEGKILLCKLMQKYSVRRLSDAPLQVETAITSRPKGGMKLLFIPRL